MHKLQLLICSILFLTTIISCYTRKEGCLDTFATNFDVAADDNCTDNCCTYPSIILQIEKKTGDSIFKVEDTLTNTLKQKFRIIDLRFYFSDFSLFQNQGSQTKTREVISNADNTIQVADDMKIWRWADESVTPGTIRAFGTFDSLVFHLGMNTVLTNNTFANLPATHALLTANTLKDDNGKIASMTLRCVRYLSATDTINLAITNTNAYKFVVKNPATTNKGDNTTIKLKVDYSVLMRGVDISLPKTSIENTIRSNINTFISVN
jgi:hypothetical protein